MSDKLVVLTECRLKEFVDQYGLVAEGIAIACIETISMHGDFEVLDTILDAISDEMVDGVKDEFRDAAKRQADDAVIGIATEIFSAVENEPALTLPHTDYYVEKMEVVDDDEVVLVLISYQTGIDGDDDV